jgi:hypothetical protein
LGLNIFGEEPERKFFEGQREIRALAPVDLDKK